MTRVLLLGCGGNAGLNFVKSLRRGMPDVHIVGCDLDRWNLVAANSDEKILLAPKSPEDKLDTIRKLIDEKRIDFVHAQPDPEVRFLLENQGALGGRVFPHALDVWHRFADKLLCQKAWSDALGLTFRSESLQALLDDPARFEPLVAGTGKAWFRAIRGAGSRAALPVRTLDQARHWASYWIETRGMKTDDFMIAEFLPGAEYAVQTFWVDGELVQAQARCRLVYFFGSIMPSGQSSTPAVAQIVSDRDVYDTAYAAIRAIDPRPHGVYCADLKRDTTGRVVPMEVNYGRFFTTSDFFAALDVNGPVALVDWHLHQRRHAAVETVTKPYVWIRGLDREPYLQLPE